MEILDELDTAALNIDLNMNYANTKPITDTEGRSKSDPPPPPE